MRVLIGTGFALLAAFSGALADGTSLAGSLWQCTRSSDRSRFVITFYPGGGVGGGEVQEGEISPYIFDATNRQEGEWPGRWEQTGRTFTWSFPDQHMTISGTISSAGRIGARLTGREDANGTKSAVTCTGLSKLPRIGEGLVIPRDGHFLDLNGGEGELKVPAGVSLQAPDR
ncbi:hypothetical protein [Microvirga pakistanensis]|uniref:hypothetical protein n=1 Tax=Microvirga pakistanensis TaxID=1682650 RepID=UPI00106C12B2|nr:hypothetical protein [Microvirga pakistanensis]